MRFEEALKVLKDGGKVRRPCMFKQDFVTLDGEYLMIHPTTNRCDIGKLPYALVGKDILADDWEVVE